MEAKLHEEENKKFLLQDKIKVKLFIFNIWAKNMKMSAERDTKMTKSRIRKEVESDLLVKLAKIDKL